MYAIVDIAGQQFKVEKEQEIFVHRLDGEAGSAVEFDHVLLLDNEGKVTVGTPVVNGALVKAKIIEHLKGDKVIVFHKKRRKGYQKENGHRPFLSKLVIEDILASGAKASKTAAKKKEEKVEVKETPQAEVKKEVKAEVKETPKAEVKKEAKAKVKETPKPEAKKEKAPAAEVKKEVKAEKKEEKPKAEAKAKPKADEKTEEK